ncbi:hypothetical protein OSTOST_22698 [Ostertagia ostertagi]
MGPGPVIIPEGQNSSSPDGLEMGPGPVIFSEGASLTSVLSNTVQVEPETAVVEEHVQETLPESVAIRQTIQQDNLFNLSSTLHAL